jgi:hypothetical protein
MASVVIQTAVMVLLCSVSLFCAYFTERHHVVIIPNVVMLNVTIPSVMALSATAAAVADNKIVLTFPPHSEI